MIKAITWPRATTALAGAAAGMLAGPAIAKHGGKFLVRGGRCEALEGTAYARNVVIEFVSMEQAMSCYKSSEYQAALKFANGASVRDIVVVEGAA